MPYTKYVIWYNELDFFGIKGKTDTLEGLKENVIVGHRIPAGTGLRKYESILVGSKQEMEELTRIKEEELNLN